MDFDALLKEAEMSVADAKRYRRKELRCDTEECLKQAFDYLAKAVAQMSPDGDNIAVAAKILRALRKDAPA